MNDDSIIPNRGNYRQLLTYKKADIIYQLTFYFCHKYLQISDRTVDQMIQSARSGKQNIIEGCMASATSAKTELKLLNVAKASLGELHEDYKDFIATRGYRMWQDDSRENIAMRRLGREHGDAEFFLNLAATRPPETIANMAIVLIRQADYLLHRQLQRLADDFKKNGGFTERLYHYRKNHREK